MQGTKLTFEEQIDHYKARLLLHHGSRSTLPCRRRTEPRSPCWTAIRTSCRMATTAHGRICPRQQLQRRQHDQLRPRFSMSIPAGGLPIIDPACNVVTSYFRSQPTREIFPTEIFRLQSSSIKNIAMNGDIRYTSANMNLPNYYENFQGLTVETSSTKSGVTTITPPGSGNSLGGYANAKREVIAVDYGIVWQATKTVSLSDQLTYSNVHQPGTADVHGRDRPGERVHERRTSRTPSLTSCVWSSSGTQTDVDLPATSTRLQGQLPVPEGSPAIGTPLLDYFGQKFVTNNATVTWDATPRATFSLTYRYRTHNIAEGSSQYHFIADWARQLHHQRKRRNLQCRPASHQQLGYQRHASRCFTTTTSSLPLAPRQTQHYRVHTHVQAKDMGDDLRRL